MQHTMIASYIAILLGYITMDNKVIYKMFDNLLQLNNHLNYLQEYLEFVSKQLPDGRFSAMLAVLDKYLNFMKLTAAVSIFTQLIMYNIFFNYHIILIVFKIYFDLKAN